MSKIIECVIDTNSKKERQELIDYVSKRELFISIVDDGDSYELVGIKKDGNIGYLFIIRRKELINLNEYKHFASTKEFIKYHEEN